MSKKKTVTRTVKVKPKSTVGTKTDSTKKASASSRPTGKKASGGKAAPAGKSSRSSNSTATNGSGAAATPAKKKTGKSTGAEKELLALIPELNTEEITWLVTQARTIIYNHKVNEVNKAARDLVEAKNRGVGETKKGNSSKKSSTAAAGESVEITQVGEGRSFILIMGKTRLFLSINELKALVKIAQAAKDSNDGAGRLYRWMKKERGDMLIDAAISGPGDSRLLKAHNLLQEKFTVG